MSWSKGPPAQARQQPSKWRFAADREAAGPDAQAHAQGQPQAHPQAQWPQDPAHEPHYADPNAAYGHDAGHAGGHPSQHYPQQGYAPQPAGYHPAHDLGQPQAPGYGYQEQPAAQYAQPAQQAAYPAGYDPRSAQQQGGSHYAAAPQRPYAAQPPQDAGYGYDLGNYMPNGTHGGPAGHASHGYAPAAPAGRQERWSDTGGYRDGYQQPDMADELGHYATPNGGQLQPGGLHNYDHDEGDDEPEEPRRSRRGLVTVSILVGAIGLGGGLAYAYKSWFMGAPKQATPVIKADARPTRIQPADPGGKQFANTDSKLLGRLGDDQTNAARAAATGAATLRENTDTDNGARRVQTLVVGRDGTLSAPPPQPVSATPVAVPGLTVIDSFPARAAPQPPRAPEATGTVAQRPPPVVTRIPPQAAEPPPAPLPRVAAVTPPPVAPAPPKRPAARDDSFVPAGAGAAAAAATAPTAAKAATSGFVAVLASQGSRMDALKTFADLQQRYTTVLQNRIPDVLEADLSAKGMGTMYRVVVGPPGSREAANDVCRQIKAAGHTSCWITAY